jgi:hypothetical protein
VLLSRRLAVLLATAMMALMLLATAAPAFAGLEGRGGGAFVIHDPCIVIGPGGNIIGSGFVNSVITPKGKSLTTGCNIHTNGKHTGWLK